MVSGGDISPILMDNVIECLKNFCQSHYKVEGYKTAH